MRIKDIIWNIRFREYEKLSSCALYNKAKDNDLFSNLKFINYFKHKGWFFWESVIFNTKISLETLFRLFEKELLQKEIINQFKFTYDLYTELYEDHPNNEHTKMMFKRSKEFLDEYKKYCERNGI